MERKTFFTDGNGFQITFDNGLVLSTQFSGFHYCSNRTGLELKQKESYSSNNAEIAVIDSSTGEFITKQAYKEVFNKDLYDDVEGYVNVFDWYKLLTWCKEQK